MIILKEEPQKLKGSKVKKTKRLKRKFFLRIPRLECLRGKDQLRHQHLIK